MQLFFVRHGETEWNLAGRYQGSLNSALTDKGRYQAKQAADHLVQVGVDAIFSSALGRTGETAQALAVRLNLDIHRIAALNEQSFGVFEGKTAEEARRAHRDDFMRFRKDRFDTPAPGGESGAEAWERQRNWLYETLFQTTHRKVALFCHGGTIQNLSKSVTGHFRDKVPNGSISILEFAKGHLHAKCWTDCRHLDDRNPE